MWMMEERVCVFSGGHATGRLKGPLERDHISTKSARADVAVVTAGRSGCCGAHNSGSISFLLRQTDCIVL